MRDLLPFVIQGVFLGVDEFVCHHRRHLGRWERLGHPVDTLTFVGALAWLLGREPGQLNLYVFVGLALASCAMVSKDEWEHHRHSTGFENWLHAWLFMLHPTTLIWAGYLWWSRATSFNVVVGGAAALAAGFAAYQIIYWNWWRRAA